MNLQAIILLVLKISIVLSVFALGLRATFSDATYLFRNPGKLLRALLSMNVVMPFLAVILVLTFDLHPAVKVALVALSVSPVPPIFPKNALKAGGKDNYSVGILVATAVLAIVVIPITMEIFERVGHTPLFMSAGAVAKMVFITVLAPLLIGIAIKAMAPAFAERAAKPTGIFATALLVLSCVPVVIGSIRTILSLFGDGTLISFIGFALIGYVAGYFLGGPEAEDRSVLGMASASRHPAIAAAIAHANFPNQKLAVPAILLYFIVSAIVTGVASKRKKPGATPAQPETRLAA